jgi:hypothetical protein
MDTFQSHEFGFFIYLGWEMKRIVRLLVNAEVLGHLIGLSAVLISI